MNAQSVSLARELHDGIAQDLVAIGYSLDLLLANPSTSEASRSEMRAIRFAVTELVDKVRKEIFLLGQESTMNLSAQIESAARIACAGLQLDLEIDDDAPALDSSTAYEIRRIAQELLRNVALHSMANRVSVKLQCSPNELLLEINDNGIGGAQAKADHYGIQAIESRATKIGADLHLDSDSTGTRVRLQLPLRDH